MMNHLLPFLHSAVAIMTPLLFAAAGGLFTEFAGVLNIALEGLLLTGAFSALAVTHFTGSILAGIIAAIISATALSALTAAVALKLRANVVISGLAANLFASGITVILSHKLFATRGVVSFNDIPPLKIIEAGALSNIPIIGDIFSGHSFFVYLSWLLLFVSWVILYRTPFGVRLRSSGSHGEALASLGIKPQTYRFCAFLISGIACGIGGSYLTLNLGVFVPNISAGKGWIALVVIFLGNRKPLGLLVAAFIFGLAESFSNYAQGTLKVPADFILAIPNVITLMGMIAVSIYTKRRNRVLR
ncbi:MAG: ABC transporter permease [Spirochaetaceae bacterium]|jgi:simple sugar transport system permease protein|nr:ABC transporter permease [Spirochaetaceae bacterium]